MFPSLNEFVFTLTLSRPTDSRVLNCLTQSSDTQNKLTRKNNVLFLRILFYFIFYTILHLFFTALYSTSVRCPAGVAWEQGAWRMAGRRWRR